MSSWNRHSKYLRIQNFAKNLQPIYSSEGQQSMEEKPDEQFQLVLVSHG